MLETVTSTANSLLSDAAPAGPDVSPTGDPSRDLLRLDKRGLFCADGAFHVDPWAPVDTAVITHAHGDHARAGNGLVYCAESCAPILRHRLGAEEKLQGVPYGKVVQIGSAKVSFHPAGHILGSAQVRVESGGKVWVVSGDYKRGADPTCAPFEVVPCDVFITEATFGLPIYRWEPGSVTAREILDWWDECITEKRPAILFCYALGKAQRVLAELALLDKTRQVYTHGAVESLVEIYRKAGIDMLATQQVGEITKGKSFAGELILAPPSAYRSPWMKRFKGADTGFASGWMRVRGARRRRGYDRGFVLSDHADWPDLIKTVEQTDAELTLPTHGSVDVLARFLNEKGRSARPLHVSAYESASEGGSGTEADLED